MDYAAALHVLATWPRRPGQGFGTPDVARPRHFAELLGNPQNKVKVIHLAGTSGKGSTATLISYLLAAEGHRTGLHLSPHVVDLRERFQINNTLLEPEKFAEYISAVLPVARQVEGLSYFELLVGLAYFIFAEEQVQYAVIETGLGGRFDATNLATDPTKVGVITRIGLDHTEILGTTLPAIAHEKAGIIHPGMTAFVLAQDAAVMEVIRKDAEGATIVPVDVAKVIHNAVSTPEGSTFSYTAPPVTYQSLKLSLLGEYQIENTALALQTVQYLAERDGWELNEAAVRQALTDVQVPGRFTYRKNQGQPLIFDSAHNPQKMAAFVTSLQQLFPGTRFTFVLAFKEGKDVASMLDLILPLADRLILTKFGQGTPDYPLHSLAPAAIAAQAQTRQPALPIEIIPEPKQALAAVLTGPPQPTVVTGSMYLLGELSNLLVPGTGH